MKTLIINGSPRIGGNTSIALEEMVKVFEQENIEVEVVQIGNKDIRGCISCGYCYKNGKCVFNDPVNELAEKFEAADALVVASPVYYASANATLIACLDRLFYSTHFDNKNREIKLKRVSTEDFIATAKTLRKDYKIKIIINV